MEVDLSSFCEVTMDDNPTDNDGVLDDLTEDDIVLLDVRMPQEAEIATIPGAVLVPLDQIENGTAIEQVRELAAGKRLYAHCKLGGRSAKALIALKREGIDGINVSGGIDAWSQEIDPSVQRY